jgi:hypothetical protein
MARKAFVHINGFTYECTGNIQGDEFDPRFQQLLKDVEALARGSSEPIQFSVVLDGVNTMLLAATQGVFAAAAFLAEEEAARPSGGRMVAM